MITKNITLYRGTSKRETLEVNDNLTANSRLMMVVKADREITSPRLIWYKTANMGGGSRINIINDDAGDYVIINFNYQDTAGLDAKIYQYDIFEYDTSNSPTKCIATGEFNLLASTQTPTDGTNLTGNGVRVNIIDASSYAVDDLLQVKETEGVKAFTNITISDLNAQLLLISPQLAVAEMLLTGVADANTALQIDFNTTILGIDFNG